MQISRPLFRRKALFLALLVVLLAAAGAEAQIGSTAPNWTVPGASSTTSSTTPGHAHALIDVTFPNAFVGVSPCRIVDTRGSAGPYGAPSLSPGVSRNFALASGPCPGFPGSIAAYSLNITVTNTLGPGFIKIYPQGGSAPVVSTLNYVAGQTVANAAIVPAGTGNGVTVVAGVSGTDLIIDVNGYYPNQVLNSSEYLAVFGSYGGGGVLFGGNNSSVKESAGVLGTESADGSSVSGVLGSAGSLSFLGSFTHGTQGVTGINHFSGTLGVAMDRAVVGVLLDSAGNDLAEGWAGKSGSTAFGFYGVRGVLISTTAGQGAAGVQGSDIGGIAGPPNYSISAGVRGDSITNYGVLGNSDYVAIRGRNFSGTTFVSEGTLATSANAVEGFGNLSVTGAKSFVDPHPTDASRVIKYVAIEGPTPDTYFRGTGRIVGGRAVITVPEDFRMVTDEQGLTVQLTPVGALATLAVESQDLKQIRILGSRDVTFHYLVQGMRAGFEGWQPIQESDFFQPGGPEARMAGALNPIQRERLVANGTYNADGTVNMTTARRLGWEEAWAARVEAMKERAAVNEALSSDQSRHPPEPIAK